MNPSEFDDDSESGGISFNELPPSVRERMRPAQQAQIPNPVQGPPQVQPQAVPVQNFGRQGPVPIETYPGQIYRPGADQIPVTPAVPPPPPAPAKDNSTLLFLGATVLLAGVGYWAYTKMEKDRRKIRVGPPAGQTANYGDDDGSDGDTDDGESRGPLDEYEDANLPEKDVDPHEEGGIKLVKG